MSDSLIKQAIDAIERRKVEIALESLLKPKGGEGAAFFYGLCSGRVQGLEEALLAIRNILEAEDTDHGSQRRGERPPYITY